MVNELFKYSCCFQQVFCGFVTAGVSWDGEYAIELARRLSQNTACTFRGIYCHEGQSYKAKGFDEIEQVSSQTTERILDVANRYDNLFCRSAFIFIIKK